MTPFDLSYVDPGARKFPQKDFIRGPTALQYFVFLVLLGAEIAGGTIRLARVPRFATFASGGMGTTPGVSKLSVGALRQRDQRVGIDEYSRVGTCFFTLVNI